MRDLKGYKPTIERVIDYRNGSPKVYCSTVLLETLNSKIENEAWRLRQDLKTRYEEGMQSTIVCAYCFKPTLLRGGGERKKRLHFTHATINASCPYQSTENILSTEDLQRRIYHGLREGPEHKKLKHQLEEVLVAQSSLSHNVSDVKVEQVIRGEYEATRRRPDISFVWRGQRIALEIQLSNTFQTVIVERHLFYKAENIYMLWIFNHLEQHENERPFSKLDVFFNNNENAFVFTEQEFQLSTQLNSLILQCYFHVYTYKAGKIVPSLESRTVSLDQLTFDENSRLIYFFDSKNSRLKAQAEFDDVQIRKNQALAKIADKVNHIKALSDILTAKMGERENLNAEIEPLRKSLMSLCYDYRSARSRRTDVMESFRKSNVSEMTKITALIEELNGRETFTWEGVELIKVKDLVGNRISIDEQIEKFYNKVFDGLYARHHDAKRPNKYKVGDVKTLKEDLERDFMIVFCEKKTLLTHWQNELLYYRSSDLNAPSGTTIELQRRNIEHEEKLQKIDNEISLTRLAFATKNKVRREKLKHFNRIENESQELGHAISKSELERIDLEKHVTAIAHLVAIQ